MSVAETTRKLTQRQLMALGDCATFPTFWWKQKTMAGLLPLGLVERVPDEDRAGHLAYRITLAGKDALKDRAVFVPLIKEDGSNAGA